MGSSLQSYQKEDLFKKKIYEKKEEKKEYMHEEKEYEKKKYMVHRLDIAPKVTIVIDFGTYGLALTYLVDGKVVSQTQWRSRKYRNNDKQKTMILIDDDGKVNQFGADANDIYLQLPGKQDNWMLFDEFVTALYDEFVFQDIQPHNKIDIKDNLIAANGKIYSSENIFIAAFKHIDNERKTYFRKNKIKAKSNQIQWILTVPVMWNDKA
eukprot:532737_1